MQAQQVCGSPRSTTCRDLAHILYFTCGERDCSAGLPVQDSIGGNARTVVVACLSPAAGAARESASTLAFAQRAGRIRNAAVVNEDTRGDSALLAAENERLRRELAVAVDACARLQQARIWPSRALRALCTAAYCLQMSRG